MAGESLYTGEDNANLYSRSFSLVPRQNSNIAISTNDPPSPQTEQEVELVHQQVNDDRRDDGTQEQQSSTPEAEDEIVCIEKISTPTDRKPRWLIQPRLYSDKQLDDLLSGMAIAKATNQVLNGELLVPFKYLILEEDVKPRLPSPSPEAPDIESTSALHVIDHPQPQPRVEQSNTL
ncbi:unnamed protein product [Didymodactylos carnosus]|uniref:Uncharacterized protein n=1 Tax=Didymodactylos carnosus TaxID=1234261 RepID=A0A8S2WUP1_9BILA|nr:unnamed protein product [Didymodactylos carnosus]CAF4461529.1 unnamed protein product [Didymodactylos carnosus]